MSNYSIKELSQISGIQPHTIRIWEQRYGLLTPHRTKTNIRFYDAEQFKKLLHICELINSGMKISHIAKLDRNQILAKIEEITAASFQSDYHFDSIINQLIISIATFDETLFDKYFSNSILRFGLLKTYIKVIYPIMVKVGLMWTKNDILPVQEHFLSNLIKQKLFSSIDSLPLTTQSDQTWLLFLGEHEEHEIGLLFANYVLRQHGKKVIYLGSNVPFDNLFDVVTQSKATHIYSFFVKNHPSEQVEDLINKWCANFKETKIFISGNPILIENISLNKNTVWIKEIQSLIEIIE